MVERTVSFKLDLQPGVAQLKQQLASVEQLSKQSMLSIQHAEERHVQKMMELRKRLSQIDDNVHVSNVNAHRKATQAIETEEQRHTLRITQMRERGQLAMTQDRGGMGLSAIGHIAQVAGFYRTGHFVRALSQFGIGSQMGGGKSGGGGGLGSLGGLLGMGGESGAGAGAAAGAAEGAAGMAGMAAAAGVAAIALGGLIVASKLVEVGFNAVGKMATDIVGAIGQIGGARGLQEMLIEATSNEKLLNQARFSVMGQERMSKGGLNTLAENLSENASAGAFSKGDWLKALTTIGTLSGNQRSIGQQTLTFLGQMANVTGGTLEQTSDIYGRIQAQNPGMNAQQIQQLMLAGHAIGQTGSFNLKELPSAVNLTKATGFLGGMPDMQKLTTVMALGTLTKSGAGTLEESGTELDAFLRQAQKSTRAGHTNLFKYNAAGQLTNLDQVLPQLITGNMMNLPKELLERESGSFIRNLRQGVSQRAGVATEDTSKEAEKKRADVIAQFETLNMTMEDFQKEVEESTTPQEKFRAEFNRIADNLEGVFLPVLKELEPVIEELANKIVAHKDEIGDAFRKFLTGMVLVVEILPDLAEGLMSLVKWALSFLPNADEKIAGIHENIATANQGIKNFSPGGALDFLPENVKQDVINQNKRAIEEQKKDLKMWEGIKKIEDLNVEDAKKTAAEKARGILPTGASDDWMQGASETPKKVDTSNEHLAQIKTYQQQQLDVLNAIKANTVKAHPGAPGREQPEGYW